jgi:hypothetical protein
LDDRLRRPGSALSMSLASQAEDRLKKGSFSLSSG